MNLPVLTGKTFCTNLSIQTTSDDCLRRGACVTVAQ